MRYFNKFFMSIKSSYLNNNKYNNTLFNNLRIYFERETKYVSNVSTLGNTFRNSKWSDLQKINIKESFLKTFIYASLTFVLLISTLMCFWGKSKSEHYLGFIPLFSVWDSALNHLLILFNEIQSQTFIIVFSLLVSITTKLKNTIPSKILNLLNISLSVTTINQNTNSNLKSVSSNYASKYTLSLPTSLRSSHLTTALKDLSILQNSLTQLKIPLTLNTPSTVPENKLLNTFISNPNTQWSLTDSESTYGKIPTLDKMFHTPLNLKNLQTYNNIHKSLTYFDFNLLTNINSGKEQRWLVKNSILTEFLTKNTNAFTQSKKLLGLSNYNNNFSNKNIWIASKLSNLNNTETLSYINNLNSSLYPTTVNNSDYNFSTYTPILKNSTLHNLTFFENSRIWTTKKFFFNNQMINNFPSHSKYYTSLNSNNVYNLSINNFTLGNTDTHKLLTPNLTRDLSSLMWPLLSTKTNYSYNSASISDERNNLIVNTANIDLLSNSDLNFIVNITANVKSSGINPNYCTPNPSTYILTLNSNNKFN